MSFESEKIINESDIDDISESIYNMITSNMERFPGKGSGCIIDSVVDYTINTLKHISLSGSSYIKLPQKLDHPKKGLFNIQTIDDDDDDHDDGDDDECFACCLIRYLHFADYNSAKIRKVDNNLVREFNFKDIKFSVKVRDIHKIEKKELY